MSIPMLVFAQYLVSENYGQDQLWQYVYNGIVIISNIAENLFKQVFIGLLQVLKYGLYAIGSYISLDSLRSFFGFIILDILLTSRVLYLILLLLVFLIIYKIYEKNDGIVILPFETKTETGNISGAALADLLTAELLRIQAITKDNYPGLEPKSIHGLAIPKINLMSPRTTLDFSISEMGSIGIGSTYINLSNLIVALKRICPKSQPIKTLTGSLQQYGSNISLVVRFESQEIHTWEVQQQIKSNKDNSNVIIPFMVKDMAYKILNGLSDHKRDVKDKSNSAKTWIGLKYYCEALKSYKDYIITGNIHDIEVASEHCLKALRAERDYDMPLELLSILGYEFLDKNNLENSRYIFDHIIEMRPNSSTGYIGMAIGENLSGMFDKAIETYNKALKIDHNDVEAWNNKGVALTKLDKVDDAIKAYNEALRIDPTNVQIWNNKGIALRKLGKVDEAFKAYNKALEIDPKNANIWNNKGVLLRNLDRLDEAIEAYNEAIKIDPKDALAWYNKGITLQKTGKVDEAIEAYIEAIKIDPRDAQAWNNKGVALAELDKLDEAIEAFNEAIKIDPKLALAWSNKGEALQKSGKLDEALESFKEAITLDPNNPKYLTNFASALDAAGRTEEAESVRNRLKNLPTNSDKN